MDYIFVYRLNSPAFYINKIESVPVCKTGAAYPKLFSFEGTHTPTISANLGIPGIF